MTDLGQSCVYIVDDDDEFRSSAASILGSGPLEILGYTTAQAFLRDFNPSKPVCAVVDLEIPDMDGLSIQDRLYEVASWLPVIYTTKAAQLRRVTSVMRAGAWHVLEKPISPTTLRETVREALQMAVQFHGFATARSEIGSRMLSLSKREREVLDLLIKGLCSREIASKLGNSHFTVEKQRANLMHKLHVKTLPALAMMYYIADREGRSVNFPGYFWWSYDRGAATISASPIPT